MTEENSAEAMARLAAEGGIVPSQTRETHGTKTPEPRTPPVRGNGMRPQPLWEAREQAQRAWAIEQAAQVDNALGLVGLTKLAADILAYVTGTEPAVNPAPGPEEAYADG